MTEEAKQAKPYLENMLSLMGIQATVEEEKIDDSTVNYRIVCNDDDAKMLIGRKGQTLEALQFLLRQMVRGASETTEHFVLDVRDYRSRREESLVDKAKRAAVAVLNGESELYELLPMSAFERRVVHNYLHEHFPELSSESHGLGPNRHIVISYKGESEEEKAYGAELDAEEDSSTAHAES